MQKDKVRSAAETIVREACDSDIDRVVKATAERRAGVELGRLAHATRLDCTTIRRAAARLHLWPLLAGVLANDATERMADQFPLEVNSPHLSGRELSPPSGRTRAVRDSIARGEGK